jgi:inorganic triphosphatase YgiF
MPNEVELKLRLSPDRVGRLKRAEILRAHARARAHTRRLLSVYFDTPRFELQSLGGALRVRHLGRRRLQTLKLPVEEASGLQVYREIERKLVGDIPDLAAVDDEALGPRIKDHAFVTTLAPVFTTEFRRTTWPVEFDGSGIEVALDIGEIRAGERTLPICEVELELKSGQIERLPQLALALHREICVAWELDTKAARGYRLAAGEPPTPERAKPVHLSDGMAARNVFIVTARACLRQMRANEACARLGEDTEGVHQFRVGLRRLRALVGAFRRTMAPEFTGYVTRELDWLQAQFGAARDWDVFIAESLQRLRARLPGDPAVASMLRAAAVLRDEGYATMRTTLDDPRYTELLLRFELALADGSWAAPPSTEGDPLEWPAVQFAAMILDKRYRRMRKIGGKRADLPEEELHRLRIAGKKLRYVADFFRSLYPKKPTTKFIAALAEVQDQLGSLNDAIVSRQLLLALEGRIANTNDIEAARHASGLVMGWQAARIDRDLAGFQSTWRQLRDRPLFWTDDVR